MVPVYPASAKVGLSSWEIGAWVEQALRRAGTFADPLPETWQPRNWAWLDRTTRPVGLPHLPRTLGQDHPARRRLVFDELFRLQLALVLRRRVLEHDTKAIRHAVSAFEVTGQAGRQLTPGRRTGCRRWSGGLPGRPALQADRGPSAGGPGQRPPGRAGRGRCPPTVCSQGGVGSGKTVVALATLLAGVQGGYQGALMVPTEVLAERHLRRGADRSLTG